MIQKGDTIFIGRYLVTGSEDSSLYVKVHSAFGKILLHYVTLSFSRRNVLLYAATVFFCFVAHISAALTLPSLYVLLWWCCSDAVMSCGQ